MRKPLALTAQPFQVKTSSAGHALGESLSAEQLMEAKSALLNTFNGTLEQAEILAALLADAQVVPGQVKSRNQ